MLLEFSAEMYLTTSLSANMRNIYIHGMITGCKSFPLQKHFVKILNKLYVSNVRKSSLSPPGGFHTQKAFTIPRSPATWGIKP